MTLIGKTGQKPEYRSSACIDPVTGRMFWVVNPTDECGYLYEVDTKDGFYYSRLPVPDDEEVVGMYIAGSNATVGLPAAVSDLTVSFPGGGAMQEQGILHDAVCRRAPEILSQGLCRGNCRQTAQSAHRGTAAAGEKSRGYRHAAR